MSQAEEFFVCPSLDLEFAATIVGTFTFTNGSGFIRHIEKILVKKTFNLFPLVIGYRALKLLVYIVVQIPREIAGQAFFSHAYHLTEYLPD